MKRFYAEQNEYGSVNLKYVENLDEKSSLIDPKLKDEKTQLKPELEVFTPPERLHLPVGMLIVIY